MKALDITYELKRNGSSQAAIARQRRVTQSMVSKVVHGVAVAGHIQSAIAKAIKRPVDEIWPQQYKKAS